VEAENQKYILHHVRDMPLSECCKLVKRILRFAPPININFSRDPFEVLVRTIISQNTTDRTSIPAFKKLKRIVDVTPKGILEADRRMIEEALRTSGLQKVKTERIRRAAEYILLNIGELRTILKLPLGEARRRLLAIPGVGYKTADVILVFCGGYNVLPVDTHIRRVAERIGCVSRKDSYDKCRENLERCISSSYGEAHLKLIWFGRNICKAINPKCHECPVSLDCPSSRDTKSFPNAT